MRLFTNNVVFGHTFPMNQHDHNLPLNPQDVVPKDNLAHVNSVEASMIAQVMAHGGGDFVVTLHSGQERLIRKSCFVDHLLHHDLCIPGFDVSEGMR